MTYPRKSLVSLEDTPYYHVVSRCVRRAWLWGFDDYAGRDYSHRKAWVLERLALLSSMFAVEVCAYAVMSNHYHLVLHINAAAARAWTKSEVVARWTKIFSRPPLIERWESGLCEGAALIAAEQIIEEWRRRLYDLSMVHAVPERASGAARERRRQLHRTVLARAVRIAGAAG